jgi:hypothetical protein
MTRGLIGQSLDATSQYRAHPTSGAADSWWAEGDPLDSGTAHHFDSNLSHLSREGLRHWAETPIALSVFTKYAGDGWSGLVDVSPPEASDIASNPHRSISWDDRTAARFGPFTVIQDREASGGVYAPRSVRVRLCVYRATAGDALTVYAALTSTIAPPSTGSYAAFGAVTPGTTGSISTATINLVTTGAVYPNRSLPSRVSGARGATDAQVPVFYLWAGWKTNTTGGTARVLSVSAWEVP